MSGDYDDLLDQQIAKKSKQPKQSTKVEPKGDYDDMLDKQASLDSAKHSTSDRVATSAPVEDAPLFQIGNIGIDTKVRSFPEAYRNVRGLISKGISPISAGIGALIDNISPEYTEGKNGKAVLVNEGFVDRMQRLEGEGMRGEGLQGFVSDPINAAPGIGRIAKPLVRTAVGAGEGAAISAADQYANEGKIEAVPTAVGAGIGALFRGAGQPIVDKFKGALAERAKYKADAKAYAEDPWEFIASHPEIDKQMSQQLGERSGALKKVDPNNILGEYRFTDMKNPAEVKALMKKIKQDIASQSTVPRKMSTITDREAREHLDRVLSAADEPIQLQFNDVAPKPKSISAGIMGEAPMMMVGGHLLAGVPGMLIGGALGSKTVRGLAASAIDKTAHTGMDVLNTKAGKALMKSAPNPNPLLINLFNKQYNQ